MLTLLPKGAQTKLLKLFCLKIFYICHRCRWHRWCTLSREDLREFSKKLEMAVMVYSCAWGKLIHEKKQKSKISWHCPFKGTVLRDGSGFWWHVWLVLSLNWGRGNFFIFFKVLQWFIMQKGYFLQLKQVYVGLKMFLFQVSLLLFGQEGLGHFFRYRPLLPIG